MSSIPSFIPFSLLSDSNNLKLSDISREETRTSSGDFAIAKAAPLPESPPKLERRITPDLGGSLSPAQAASLDIRTFSQDCREIETNSPGRTSKVMKKELAEEVKEDRLIQTIIGLIREHDFDATVRIIGNAEKSGIHFSHQELVGFLEEVSQHNEKLLNYFILRTNPKGPPSSPRTSTSPLIFGTITAKHSPETLPEGEQEVALAESF